VASTGLPDAPATFHIDLQALLNASTETRRFAPPPRFPSVEYHVNVLAPSHLWTAELLATVDNTSLDWLVRSAVRDVYEGKSVPLGHKRVTVELEFNHPDRSLTHDEVLPLVQELKSALSEQSLTVEV
jgi:phenylalanyl-tRNA synthetase beta chain